MYNGSIKTLGDSRRLQLQLIYVQVNVKAMGGGEILKKGWLIKSPPLEGSGLKVSYVVCEHSECGVRWLWCKISQTCLNKSINQIMLVLMFTVLL